MNRAAHSHQEEVNQAVPFTGLTNIGSHVIYGMAAMFVQKLLGGNRAVPFTGLASARSHVVHGMAAMIVQKTSFTGHFHARIASHTHSVG